MLKLKKKHSKKSSSYSLCVEVLSEWIGCNEHKNKFLDKIINLINMNANEQVKENKYQNNERENF